MRIEPTVSRMVWFYPAAFDSLNKGREGQPLSGQIAHINRDGTLNLLVLSPIATTDARLNVPLLEGGDHVKMAQEEGIAYCTWMPYQLGQAARAEQLERRSLDFRDGQGAAASAGGEQAGRHIDLKLSDTQSTQDRPSTGSVPPAGDPNAGQPEPQVGTGG